MLCVTTGIAASAGCARSVNRLDAIGVRVSHRILFVLPSGRSPLATNSVANTTPTTSGGRPTAQGIPPPPTSAQDGSPWPVATAVPPQPAPVVCEPGTDAAADAECCPTAGSGEAQPTPTRATAARSIGRPMPARNAQACAERHRSGRWSRIFLTTVHSGLTRAASTYVPSVPGADARPPGRGYGHALNTNWARTLLDSTDTPSMARSVQVARVAAGFALVAGGAGCSQGSVATQTATTQPVVQQVQFNRDGSIPACRAALVTFTTRALVLGSPHSTAVEVTATVVNRGRFTCALPQPTTACFTDPGAEIDTQDGRVVWDPRYLALPCPARPPGAPAVLVDPGRSAQTTQSWNLAICQPNGGCLVPDAGGGSTQARAAPGNYVAVGTSDTVGTARGASFSIR
jgi:hypothetical protein